MCIIVFIEEETGHIVNSDHVHDVTSFQSYKCDSVRQSHVTVTHVRLVIRHAVIVNKRQFTFLIRFCFSSVMNHSCPRKYYFIVVLYSKVCHVMIEKKI